MKKEIVFATNNAHKLAEIKQIIGDQYQVRSLKEIGFDGDIPETAPTIAGNALQKARFIYERYGLDCFADDTGLEVEALGGAPGVYSARYAGAGCSYADNVNKLLDALQQHQNRNSRFITVIALIVSGEEVFF
jgi:XTP/dITP diphosphohydrolase